MAEVTDVGITSGIPDTGTGTVPTLSKTNTLLGAVTETAPASDTASSGANGRLQRIAQRLTSVLAKLPALGTAGSASTDVITVQGIASGTAQPVTGTITAVTALTNALPAGTNNIGDVDVLTVPADPFGANADAASTTGSISAKLRAIATALGVTAFDLGPGTGGVRTLRVAMDTSQVSGNEFEDVIAAQTAQVLGATGAAGDYIDHVVVVPETTSPGAVTLLDGAGTTRTLFVGGTSSVSNLVPFDVPLGLVSVSGAWKITTGSNVHVIGCGNFT